MKTRLFGAAVSFIFFIAGMTHSAFASSDVDTLLDNIRTNASKAIKIPAVANVTDHFPVEHGTKERFLGTIAVFNLNPSYSMDITNKPTEKDCSISGSSSCQIYTYPFAMSITSGVPKFMVPKDVQANTNFFQLILSKDASGKYQVNVSSSLDNSGSGKGAVASHFKEIDLGMQVSLIKSLNPNDANKNIAQSQNSSTSTDSTKPITVPVSAGVIAAKHGTGAGI